MNEREWLERHMAEAHGIEPGINMPLTTLDRMHVQDHEHQDHEVDQTRLGYALLVASLAAGFIAGMLFTSAIA